MKSICPITIFLAALLLSGCGAAKDVVIETKETVRVITHTEIVPIIAIFDIPEAAAIQTVRDSSSHLETDFAESDAKINRDGTLFHSIKNKSRSIEKQFDIPVEHRDSLVYIEKEVPVYIEKQLTKSQQIRLDGFWWLLSVVLIIIVCKIVKIWIHYRKLFAGQN